MESKRFWINVYFLFVSKNHFVGCFAAVVLEKSKQKPWKLPRQFSPTAKAEGETAGRNHPNALCQPFVIPAAIAEKFLVLVFCILRKLRAPCGRLRAEPFGKPLNVVGIFYRKSISLVKLGDTDANDTRVWTVVKHFEIGFEANGRDNKSEFLSVCDLGIAGA